MRKVCNYIYASNKATRKNALYQRGQFFITNGPGKPYTYACMFIDKNNDESLLGYAGQMAKAKTFINKVYQDNVMVDALINLEYSKFAKKYLLKSRPDKKVKQVSKEYNKAIKAAKASLKPVKAPAPKAPTAKKKIVQTELKF